MTQRVQLWSAFLACIVLTGGCGTIEYDLSTVPIPVSAKPADPNSGTIVPLEIEKKSILWVHGLLGQTSPDVAAFVAEAAHGYDRIAGFRVSVSAGFHDWLLTHLSGTLARFKTVSIEGHLVKDASR